MRAWLFAEGLIVASLVASSCRNPLSPNDSAVILRVTSIDAPASVARDAKIPVVFKIVTGGCRRFDHLEVTRSESGATVVPWGEDSSLGRKDVVCPQDIIEESHSYEFSPPFASSFQIQVDQGRLTPKAVTVQVQ